MAVSLGAMTFLACIVVALLSSLVVTLWFKIFGQKISKPRIKAKFIASVVYCLSVIVISLLAFFIGFPIIIWLALPMMLAHHFTLPRFFETPRKRKPKN
ncbi:MAG: hypothetical protein AAF846_10800 [Chloroflexota bacterium]